MSEPVAEISKHYTIQDFLKSKVDRLDGIGLSREPQTVISRDSLSQQINSIREGIEMMINENDGSLKNGSDISIDEFVDSYSRVTEELRGYDEKIFGEKNLDTMNAGEKARAIETRNCINLRAGTEKEMGQFAKIFRKNQFSLS